MRANTRPRRGGRRSEGFGTRGERPKNGTGASQRNMRRGKRLSFSACRRAAVTHLHSHKRRVKFSTHIKSAQRDVSLYHRLFASVSRCFKPKLLDLGGFSVSTRTAQPHCSLSQPL